MQAKWENTVKTIRLKKEKVFGNSFEKKKFLKKIAKCKKVISINSEFLQLLLFCWCVYFSSLTTPQ